MKFRLPLVRFSTKERLEELQNGTMYLRNACHYRKLENECGNSIQGDVLEAKIPYSGRSFHKVLDDNGIPMDIVGSLNLMRANTFICSMYAYNDSNVVEVGENCTTFRINTGHDDLKKLGEHALVIFGADRFIQSFESAKISCIFRLQGYVEYRDLYNKKVADAISENYISYHVANDCPKKMEHFELIKDTKYTYQQEYRFIVHTDCSIEDTINEYKGIIKNGGIEIKIEDCKPYSFMCPTEDLLNRTLFYKWGNDKFEVGFVTF